MHTRRLAEKGVTIVERGTSSTRWRDYADIVRLAEIHDIDDDLLLASAQAVADYRGVALTPVGPMLEGYGRISQPKWVVWRRKEGSRTSATSASTRRRPLSPLSSIQSSRWELTPLRSSG